MSKCIEFLNFIKTYNMKILQVAFLLLFNYLDSLPKLNREHHNFKKIVISLTQLKHCIRKSMTFLMICCQIISLLYSRNLWCHLTSFNQLQKNFFSTIMFVKSSSKELFSPHVFARWFGFVGKFLGAVTKNIMIGLNIACYIL